MCNKCFRSFFSKSTRNVTLRVCTFICLFWSVCVKQKSVEALGLHYNTLDYSSYGGFIYWITPNFPLNSQLSGNRPWLTSGCNQRRKSASLPFVLFIHKPMLELRCLFKVILPVQLLYGETFGRFYTELHFLNNCLWQCLWLCYIVELWL